MRHGRRGLRQTGRPDGRRKSCVGPGILCGMPRSGCRFRDASAFRSGRGDAPAFGTDAPCRPMGADRGGSTGCVLSLTDSVEASGHGSAAASRDHLTARGARRDEAESLIEADAVEATEAVAARGGILALGCRVDRRPHQPRRQSAPDKRPPATVARQAGAAAGDGTATASKGLAQQCGSASSPSRDGGSPSKTDHARRPGPQSRRRARQLPSFPRKKVHSRNALRFGARRCARSRA